MLNSTIKNSRTRKSVVSVSPMTKNRSRSVSATTCKNIKFISQLKQAQQELTKNRDKMATCLEIYSILEGNEQQQRCLKHNNLLSLYCFNQRKILCVNCIYGVSKHKTHKVIPLKDCMHQVEQDNKNLKKIIENQLLKLQSFSKISKDNKYILQNDLKQSLKNLNIKYEAKKKQLEAAYASAKAEITQIYQPIVSKCQKVEKMFEQFRFRVWQGLMRYGQRQSIGKNNTQVTKHIFFISVLQLCQNKIRQITQRQLQSLFRKANNINF